ncbi:MAG: tetratricopeptide repeat protein [Acidobacteriaceae bacterium]|nr:tetratricopeptide repeat protein [Acidobacteriaceae bacterium]
MLRLLFGWWNCLIIATAVLAQQAHPGTSSEKAALSQKAVEAERNGDFAGAISAFEQLIHKGGDSPGLRSNLGIAYFQLHEYPEALREFRVALTKEPDSIPANFFSGLALLKLQRPRQALPYLRRARHLQPDTPEVTLSVAQAEVACNEIAQARDSYEQVTRLAPQNAEAWYGLGITERALAEHDLKKAASKSTQVRALLEASRQAIAKGTQLEPDSVHAHMILGECFRIAERYDQAVEEYEAATACQPDLAAAWAGLATAYSAAGEDDKALKAAKRALELDPRDAETDAVIADTLLRQGDASAARPYALNALALQPDLASGHLVLAKIYLSDRQPAKALPELQSAARQDTDGRTYYLLATALRELGKTQEAAMALQKYRRLHEAHVAPMAK